MSIIRRGYRLLCFPNRGKCIEKKGIYIMNIFHPAAILRYNSKKSLFCMDLKEIKRKFNEIK